MHNFITKKLCLSICLLISVLILNDPCVYAMDKKKTKDQKEAKKEKVDYDKLTSKDFVGLSWQASGERDLDKLRKLVKACLKKFGKSADKLHKKLKGFPTRSEIKKYEVLNDVATCLFIEAEALMNHGKTEEAVVAFTSLVKTYPWAQAWDPRGWHWSIKEKSESSIAVMTGKEIEEEEEIEPEEVIRTVPKLQNHGTEKVIDYSKYGTFHFVGTADYRYEVTDPRGLLKAVGEGIYPYSKPMFKNERYRELQKEGRLKGTHWDFVNTEDLEAAYYKWVTAPEPQGVKLYFTALIFEKAGLYYKALKAYHALVVHFPKTVAWTYWQTPWYPPQAAIAKIKHIIRIHPELNLEAKWMKLEVKNGFDNDVKNDSIIPWPGVIREKGIIDKAKDKLHLTSKKEKLGKVVQKRGKGEVRLVQYENGHWQLLVKDKPYVIKGITYAPTKIGQSPDKGTIVSWMKEDSNENGIIDGPYEAWVDKNRNNVQGGDEPVVGDFQLLKEMGVNTIREYHQPFELDKKFLREMHKKYGFRMIMGDFLGKYTLGSGATWFEGTDYENEEHKKNMMASVKKMVMKHKDEPYVLFWLLGNENNYGVASNADKKPEAYFKFVDEVAKMIKEIDPNHPVAVCNGDTLFLDIFGKFSPNVDIFSANVYRGDFGFSSFWEQVFDASGKPAFITEYGSPAYARYLTLEEAEKAQADYHLGNWLDIEENLAGTSDGIGNALGGVIFEWLDEWWKNYEPYRHDKKSDAIGPFPGGYYYEEWFGIVSQGNGKNSPFLRQLRPSYDLYKKMWQKYE